MTAAITGGGTGGHIYPALAVAEALRLRRPDWRIVYIGGRDGMEERLAAEHNLPFVGVTARKLRKLASPDTLVTVAALGSGWLQARCALRRLQPSVLLGTGGYVAAASVLAGATLRVPIVLHEQNAIAGRTNRWLARWAARVCITFPGSVAAFPAGKTVITGLPLRRAVLCGEDSARAKERLGIPPDAFVLLVLGGSQGAVAINKVVREALPHLLPPVFVLHQTGPRDAASNGDAAPANYRSYAYLDGPTLALAYGAASLAVSRCGASTLAELAANGVPAILVPYPAAYADHQTANAREVADRGAAMLLPQSQLTAEKLAASVASLVEDRSTLAAMSRAARAMGRPEAADRVADVLLECARP